MKQIGYVEVRCSLVLALAEKTIAAIHQYRIDEMAVYEEDAVCKYTKRMLWFKDRTREEAIKYATEGDSIFRSRWCIRNAYRDDMDNATSISNVAEEMFESNEAYKMLISLEQYNQMLYWSNRMEKQNERNL